MTQIDTTRQKIRPRSAATHAEKYLDVLGVFEPALGREDGSDECATPGAAATSPAAEPASPLEDSAYAEPAVGRRTPSTRHRPIAPAKLEPDASAFLRPPALREWKLSARLDFELLSEIYGAAEALAKQGATVSAMVEEALRLYLPQLRERHNDGEPFPKRGPRSRGKKSPTLLLYQAHDPRSDP